MGGGQGKMDGFQQSVSLQFLRTVCMCELCLCHGEVGLSFGLSVSLSLCFSVSVWLWFSVSCFCVLVCVWYDSYRSHTHTEGRSQIIVGHKTCAPPSKHTQTQTWIITWYNCSVDLFFIVVTIVCRDISWEEVKEANYNMHNTCMFVWGFSWIHIYELVLAYMIICIYKDIYSCKYTCIYIFTHVHSYAFTCEITYMYI